MLQSSLFIPAVKDDPRDEEAPSARLLVRGGYISKVHSGVYTYLPLGLKALRKVEAIVREEMDGVGGQEVLMPALHPLHLWQKTGRDVSMKDSTYQFEDSGGHKVGLGATHEEVITDMIAGKIVSFRDTPHYLYQIQSKFRDEPRAKSGLLRGKEFLMKDLYSFHSSTEDLNEFYAIMRQAYLRIFSRCGLHARVVEASGGAFTKEHSHEFMVESAVGEDTVVVCDACEFAQNTEICSLAQGDACPQCGTQGVRMITTIEVGNIFKLGTRFSDAFSATFTAEDGSVRPLIMGCFGIGIGRLLATIVETHHDGAGIIWPEAVSPYKVHVLALSQGQEFIARAREIHDELAAHNIEVLLDDREEGSAGEKLALSDLLGFPYRIVVSQKNKDQIELKQRDAQEGQLGDASEILAKVF